MLLKYIIIFIVLFFTTITLDANPPKYEDISTNKKEKKLYAMGKKVFQKKCKQEVDFNKYKDIYALHDAVQNQSFCSPLKAKYVEAVTLYLWDVKRVDKAQKKQETIKIDKNEKCPVCGMFIYKYPKWATQIFYKDHHFSFDGVKDMMKYYFEHRSGISKILVTDYYTQKAIDAREAFYVIGSDIYGPMGDELIPFENEKDAKTFYMDHKAKEIVSFKNITYSQVKALDE